MTYKRLVWSMIISMAILYLVTATLLIKNGYERPFHPYTQLDRWIFSFGWSMGDWGYALMTALILLFIGTIYWLMGKFSSNRRKKARY